MKTSQKGFAALEGLLILVIVAVIGGTGYYVWHSKQQTDKTLTSAQTESTVAKVAKKSTPTDKTLLLTYSRLAFTYDLTQWSVAANNSTIDPTCGKADTAEMQSSKYSDLVVTFELGQCGKGGGSCKYITGCTAESKLLATVKLNQSDNAYVVADETTNPGDQPVYVLWLSGDKTCADYICGLSVTGLKSNPALITANYQPSSAPASLQGFADTPEIKAATALLQTAHYQN